MRRVYATGEAAVREALNQQLTKFEYPDELGGGSVSIGGGGGGMPTVVVAASDASDISKSKADLVCSGVNDDAVINQAFDLAAGYAPGRVVLTEGRFYVTPNSVDVPSDTWLQGSGPLSTVIQPGSAVNNSYLVQMEDDSKISDLTVFGSGGGTGATGIRISDVDVWVRDIWAQSIERAITVAGNRLRVHGLRSFSVTYDLYVENSGYADISITEGYLAGSLFMQNAVTVQITNNMMAGAIVGDDVRGWVIADNQFLNSSAFSNAQIELGQDNTGDIRDPGCVVSGNIWVTSSWNLIDADGVEDLTVIGNRGFENGAFWFQNCPRIVVSGNSTRYGFGDDGGSGTVATFQFDGCDDGIVTGNNAEDWVTGGFYFSDCDRMTVTGNHSSSVDNTTDDTYDCYNISGASNRNLLEANTARAAGTGFDARYGFNIEGTGECNMVVGNDFGDPDDYGTDALNDTASNTQLFYPNDVTYGDNFTDCGSGS